MSRAYRPKLVDTVGSGALYCGQIKHGPTLGDSFPPLRGCGPCRRGLVDAPCPDGRGLSTRAEPPGQPILRPRPVRSRRRSQPFLFRRCLRWARRRFRVDHASPVSGPVASSFLRLDFARDPCNHTISQPFCSCPSTPPEFSDCFLVIPIHLD